MKEQHETTYSGSSCVAQPNKGGRPKKVVVWLDAIATIETDDCVLFPFRRNRLGYGLFVKTTGRKNRKVRRAHNYVCEVAHGPAPTDKHICAHSCDTPACVNPRHLRWATQKENVADMVARGRAAKPSAKVTPAIVAEIRERAKTEMQKDLAKEFGLSKATTCQIVSRQLWKDVA